MLGPHGEMAAGLLGCGYLLACHQPHGGRLTRPYCAFSCFMLPEKTLFLIYLRVRLPNQRQAVKVQIGPDIHLSLNDAATLRSFATY